jgi:PAS domain S-box-containing protein
VIPVTAISLFRDASTQRIDFSCAGGPLEPTLERSSEQEDRRYAAIAVGAVAAGLALVVVVLCDLVLVGVVFDEAVEPWLDGAAIGFALVGAVAAASGMLGLRREARALSAAAEVKQSSIEKTGILLRDALDRVSDAIALWDREGRLVLANRRFGEIYSHSAPHLKPGLPWQELARLAAASGKVANAVGRVEEWVHEQEHLMRPDEPPHEYRASRGTLLRYQNFRTSDGGIVSVRNDISELKERERALRESEQRLRDIAESAADWFWEMDRELRFSVISGNWHPPDYIGKTRWQTAGVADPEADPLWRGHLEVLRARAPFRDFRFVARAPSGTTRHVRTSGKPVFDDTGEFVGYRGTATDETEAVKAVEATKRRESQLMSAIEGVPIGVSFYDAEDRLVFWNGEAATIAGLAGSTYARGQTFESILRSVVGTNSIHDARGREVEYLAARLAMHQAPRGPFEIVVGNNRTTQVDEFRTGDGSTLIIHTDISAATLREAELQQAQKMEALGKLTGGVAHDFNNLIGVILGNLDLLTDELAPHQRSSPLLANAVRAADRGAQLTQRLLAFSRKQVLRPVDTDINEAASGMVSLFARTLGERITVRTEFAGGLPSVRIDRSQLESALLNLAVNARDAMTDGGTLTVATRAVELASGNDLGLAPGRYVAVDVVDTGVGMSPEVASQAFDPFFTTKGVGAGSGLGLSMVQGFVTQSGGAVRIASTHGQGTTIRLLFPAIAAPVAAASAETPGSLPRGNETVLIVEDDPDLRELTASVLRGLGYRALAAADGAGAMTLIEGQPEIELLFTDIVLPGGMGGTDLVVAARQRRPELSVLYTSGHADDPRVRDGVGPGDAPFLRKPFRKPELAFRVREVLDQRAHAPE